MVRNSIEWFRHESYQPLMVIKKQLNSPCLIHQSFTKANLRTISDVRNSQHERGQQNEGPLIRIKQVLPTSPGPALILLINKIMKILNL